MTTDTDGALGELTGTCIVPEVPCPDLPCGDCGRPRLLDAEAGYLACGNLDCPNLGILAPFWRELDALVDAGVPDPCPAGWPRPRHAGLPVPWLTPVAAAAGPLWRLVHGRRLAHAQDHWVCQVCGEPCDPAATLIVDGSGRCRTSAPLHDGRCAELSAAVCPALARSAAYTVTVTATRADVVVEGETDLALGWSRWWRVLPGPGLPLVPLTSQEA